MNRQQQHSLGNSTHTSSYESRTNAFVSSRRLSGRDLLNERSLDSESTATASAAHRTEESVLMSNHHDQDDPDHSSAADDVEMEEEEDEPDEPFFISSHHSAMSSAVAAAGAPNAITRSDAMAAVSAIDSQHRHIRQLSSNQGQSQSLFLRNGNDNDVLNEGRLLSSSSSSSSGHVSLNSSLRSSSDRGVFLGLNDPMTINNTIALTNSVMGLTGTGAVGSHTGSPHSAHTPVRSLTSSTHRLTGSPHTPIRQGILGGLSGLGGVSPGSRGIP